MANPSVTARNFDPLKDPGLDNDPMYHITRVFVYFLQNLFRDFPEGCGMKWRPNEETTELIISAEKSKQDAIEKTPHITCVYGASRWSNLGLDQLQGMKFSTGQRTHTDLIPSTMAYHCQAKEGVVSRRIAWNASFYTNVLKRVIMRGGSLFHVDSKHDISAETGPTVYTGPTAEEEIVSVVVTVPFYWQTQWRITDPAVVWRRLKMDLQVGISPIVQTKVRPPSIHGVAVQTTPIDGVRPTAFTQSLQVDSYPEEEE